MKRKKKARANSSQSVTCPSIRDGPALPFRIISPEADPDKLRKLLGPEKISATLLRYAAPVTDRLGSDRYVERLQRALDIVGELWNCLTFQDGFIDRCYLWSVKRSAPSQLSKLLSISEDEARSLVSELIQRRYSEFAQVTYGFKPILVSAQGRSGVTVIAGAIARDEAVKK